MNNLADVRREFARLYRAMKADEIDCGKGKSLAYAKRSWKLPQHRMRLCRTGRRWADEIDCDKGKSLAYVLGLLARAIEGGEFEKRIEALEARAAGQSR